MGATAARRSAVATTLLALVSALGFTATPTGPHMHSSVWYGPGYGAALALMRRYPYPHLGRITRRQNPD
ncbi:hypothetical protein [Nonomuraea aurantiaca]|uniref:hypothetical protein n=1 Tax=Nonomuraea aurantiaca TaxID=2878562 RepID=UPI001CD97F72|nr:hypothetical protein [Nonomuraea aurantiaca]MCA2221108.1 hypothetical protein [Nonomuraea aurantiaca]